MKRNCRIIVNQRCNYSCQYCCNKLPGMLDRFQDVSLNDLHDVISRYNVVCISGGEPLMPGNICRSTDIAQLAKSLNKEVYIYTNLHYLPNMILVSAVDGWSVGFHPSQVSINDFMIRVHRMVAIGAKNVRVLVEVSQIHKLMDLVGVVEIKTWKMNECDKTDIEDWYKVTS